MVRDMNCLVFVYVYLSTVAIKSIPNDHADTRIDSQSNDTSSYPTITEENDIDVSCINQPEVFLTAKTVHIRYLTLLIQMKQILKHYNPQCFFEALKKLKVNTRTSIQPNIIPLLSSEYLKEFKNFGSEGILRSAFLWTWNNHSILRALLEACNCQDGIKMLDEFESQIDTNQPMELFPIPPPSMKMAPFPSCAYTVLSIRCENNQTDLASLQYINDVAEIMITKFKLSQHSLQLLAQWASPLMLYWMIPKNIVSLISEGVEEHLDFLKAKGFSEIAIYPSTILFNAYNLSHGSFALLSSNLQVRYL